MSVTVDQIVKLRLDPATLSGDGVTNPITVIGGTGGGGGGRALQTVLAAGTTPLDFNDEAFDYWQIDLGSVSASTITATGALASAVPMLTLHFINVSGDTDVTFPASFKDAAGNSLGTVTFSVEQILPFYYANGEYITNYVDLATGTGSDATSIDGIPVSITSPQDDEVLTLSGGTIINAPSQGGGGGGFWEESTDANGNDVLRYSDRPILLGATDAAAGFAGAAWFGGALRLPFLSYYGTPPNPIPASTATQAFAQIPSGALSQMRYNLIWGSNVFTNPAQAINLQCSAVLGVFSAANYAGSDIFSASIGGFRPGSGHSPAGVISLNYATLWGTFAGSAGSGQTVNNLRCTNVGYGAGFNDGNIDTIVIGCAQTPAAIPGSANADEYPLTGLTADHDGQILVGNILYQTGMKVNATSYLMLPRPSAAQVPGQAGMPPLANGMVWYDDATDTFKGYQNGSIVTFTTS